MTAPRVLVAGVGNVFLGDDGFGVEVVRRLAAASPPPGVKIADFGIRGFDLAHTLLDAYELVILVDAARRGGPPGALYLLEPEQLNGDQAAPEPHGMVPTRALRLARAMGAAPERVLVVGCEPESFGEAGVGRMGLSATVSAAVAEAASLVNGLVRRHLDLQPIRP